MGWVVDEVETVFTGCARDVVLRFSYYWGGDIVSLTIAVLDVALVVSSSCVVVDLEVVVRVASFAEISSWHVLDTVVFEDSPFPTLVGSSEVFIALVTFNAFVQSV